MSRRASTRRRSTRHTRRPPNFTSPPMAAEVGKKLIDISIELLDKLYVHLPLKRSMYAVNPIQRVRLLARRLSAISRGLSQRLPPPPNAKPAVMTPRATPRGWHR